MKKNYLFGLGLLIIVVLFGYFMSRNNIEELTTYQLKTTNYTDENIVLVIRVSGDDYYQDRIGAANLPETGHPVVSGNSLALPDKKLKLEVIIGDYKDSFRLDPKDGKYINISYGTPGLVKKGGYISITQSAEETLID